MMSQPATHRVRYRLTPSSIPGNSDATRILTFFSLPTKERVIDRCLVVKMNQNINTRVPLEVIDGIIHEDTFLNIEGVKLLII